jgi:hypothetical protein
MQYSINSISLDHVCHKPCPDVKREPMMEHSEYEILCILQKLPSEMLDTSKKKKKNKRLWRPTGLSALRFTPFKIPGTHSC